MNILKYYLAFIFLISTEAYCGSIGWQNIPSPDFSSSNALLKHSSDQFNSSMNNLSNSISDIIEAREKKKAQQEELDRQEAYNNQLRAQNNAMQEELARRTAYENELKERKRLEAEQTYSAPTDPSNYSNTPTTPMYTKIDENTVLYPDGLLCKFNKVSWRWKCSQQ